MTSKDSPQNKYTTLSNAVKDHYNSLKTIKEKVALKKIFQGEGIRKSKMKTAIVRETLGIDQIKQNQTAPKKNILIEQIKNFFDRDDVSRATAGKRETVTYKKRKMQKRYLLDTMKNLHRSFIKEIPGERCCYSYFIKHRPFYVKPPTVGARETCLCRTHINAQYMINILHRNKIIPHPNMNELIASTVCSTYNGACMTGNCQECKTKQIVYYTRDDHQLVKWPQWIRASEMIEKSGKKVRITKNVKETSEGTVSKLIENFNRTLVELKKHIYKIKIQYKSYRAAIDNLKNDEVVLHVDFSENYNCKHFEEVQSHHFGGSRKQITLHTGVMYTKNEGEDKPTVTSFCTISGNNSHNPVSIWAHLHPVISAIKADYPHITTVHFFSDGPATQYRQKLNFHFICSKIFKDYNFIRVTWNFFEAGHGKGTADGVGGYLKRTADEKVATGLDISDAETFFHILKQLSKVRLYLVTDSEIHNVEKTVPKNLVPLQGTMQVHQVFTDIPDELQYRDLSCFCQRGFCACMNPKKYQPVPVSVVDTNGEINCSDRLNEKKILANISNIVTVPRKTYYSTFCTSSSSSNDEPLANVVQPSVSYVNEKQLIEKENVHPLKIFDGVHVLVKVASVKDKYYTYLGVAKSEVDEEGEIKIMFYKTVDGTGKRFKAVETDISYEPYENILEIVPNPKMIVKGKRVYFDFDQPLNVFEK
ncbi:unnamed protein product [Euphydryas editha]|uniref:Uncharacterized protein n=2 Tax=Euphydryas editha TaxID=104508 RepID=A0AAU9UCB7_EUPED|nr:unnamed protein product [Euphydryas editha]